MTVQSIKCRLNRLECAANPPEIVLLPITDDMTVEQAAQTYRDNLRRFNEWYRAHPPKPYDGPELTDDHAAELYRDLLASFPNH